MKTVFKAHSHRNLAVVQLFLRLDGTGVCAHAVQIATDGQEQHRRQIRDDAATRGATIGERFVGGILYLCIVVVALHQRHLQGRHYCCFWVLQERWAVSNGRRAKFRSREVL